MRTRPHKSIPEPWFSFLRELDSAVHGEVLHHEFAFRHSIRVSPIILNGNSAQQDRPSSTPGWLIKSPKVYWEDSGLACYLLGVTSSAELERSPFLGALFEGFIAAEILKSQANQGMRKELYYFRDQQGLEEDFLAPHPNSSLWLIGAKAGKTVRPSMANPLVALRRAMLKRSGRLIVVHRKSRSQLQTAAIARGVEVVDVERFIQELAGTR